MRRRSPLRDGAAFNGLKAAFAALRILVNIGAAGEPVIALVTALLSMFADLAALVQST
jgi:hypothetical protein